MVVLDRVERSLLLAVPRVRVGGQVWMGSESERAWTGGVGEGTSAGAKRGAVSKKIEKKKKVKSPEFIVDRLTPLNWLFAFAIIARSHHHHHDHKKELR